MVKLLKKVCPRCNKAFGTYTEEMVYCNSTCQVKHVYEQMTNRSTKIVKGNCQNCNIEIGGAREFCCAECRQLYNRAKQEQKKNIEYWTKPKSQSKKRSVNFEELNRRAEYKRLYDEFYITRQINGRARELI